MRVLMQGAVVLGLAAGVVSIIKVMGGEPESAVVPWVIAVGCLVVAFVLRCRVIRCLGKYKGVKIIYLREAPGVWSSHIDGYPASFGIVFGGEYVASFQME